MFPVDPRFFLGDPQIKVLEDDRRVDLQATNCPSPATGVYTVYSRKCSDSEMLVVKGVFPYAMARVNVGLVLTESFEVIPSNIFSGHGVFQILVNGQAPNQYGFDYNQPTDAANYDNSQRDRDNGVCWVSDNPRADAMRCMFNPMWGFKVNPGQTLLINFRLIRAALSNPIPGRYAIPPAVGGDLRVDFAGAYVAGLVMPSQYYDQLCRTITGYKENPA